LSVTLNIVSGEPFKKSKLLTIQTKLCVNVYI
jgi:hypothetical protein